MTFDGRVEAAFTVPSAVTIAVTTTSPASGPTTVTITPGTYSGITALCTQVATDLNAQKPLTAASWTVSMSTGASGTGKVTIAAGAGTYTITWSTTVIRDILGYTTTLGAGVSTSTSPSQARGVWIPDCPLKADSDARQAPRVSDLRTTVGPTGYIYSKRGTSRYRLTGLTWSHVAINRVWTSEETTTNQSYETFHGDAIDNTGSISWFAVNASLIIYDQRGVLVGSAKSIANWNLTTPPSLADLRMAIADYTGLWAIVWSEIVSDG